MSNLMAFSLSFRSGNTSQTFLLAPQTEALCLWSLPPHLCRCRNCKAVLGSIELQLDRVGRLVEQQAQATQQVEEEVSRYQASLWSIGAAMTQRKPEATSQWKMHCNAGTEEAMLIH